MSYITVPTSTNCLVAPNMQTYIPFFNLIHQIPLKYSIVEMDFFPKPNYYLYFK